MTRARTWEELNKAKGQGGGEQLGECDTCLASRGSGFTPQNQQENPNQTHMAMLGWRDSSWAKTAPAAEGRAFVPLIE